MNQNQSRSTNSGMNRNMETNDGGKKTLLWIVGIIIVLAVVGIIYAVTQRTIKNSNQNSEEDNVALQDDNQIAGDRVAAPVTYTGFDVVNLQTFPYRVQVRVRGTVPEGCATSETPSASLSGKVFAVSMTASKSADAVCTQVVTLVEGVVELPVGGLAAGTYTVKVGSLTAKTFTLSQNNSVQYSSDK